MNPTIDLDVPIDEAPPRPLLSRQTAWSVASLGLSGAALVVAIAALAGLRAGNELALFALYALVVLAPICVFSAFCSAVVGIVRREGVAPYAALVINVLIGLLWVLLALGLFDIVAFWSQRVPG
jgi:hypothetical protein